MGQAPQLNRPAHFPQTWRHACRLSVQRLTKLIHLPVSDPNRAQGETATAKKMSTRKNQEAIAFLQKNGSGVSTIATAKTSFNHRTLGLKEIFASIACR